MAPLEIGRPAMKSIDNVRPRSAKTSIKLVTELILFNLSATNTFSGEIICIYITIQLGIKHNMTMPLVVDT